MYGSSSDGMASTAAVQPSASESGVFDTRPHAKGTRQSRRNLAAFWLLGLLNNYSYVFMNAAAQSISDGGVGLVYLANIAPTMLIKLTVLGWHAYYGRFTYLYADAPRTSSVSALLACVLTPGALFVAFTAFASLSASTRVRG